MARRRAVNGDLKQVLVERIRLLEQMAALRRRLQACNSNLHVMSSALAGGRKKRS